MGKFSGLNLGVPVHVYGPETHMTAVVGAALGRTELPPTPSAPQTTGQFLLPGTVRWFDCSNCLLPDWMMQ